MYYGGGLNNTVKNLQNTPVPYDFVTAYLRGRTDGFMLKGGDATTGTLTTMYDGPRPFVSPDGNNTQGRKYQPAKKQGAMYVYSRACCFPFPRHLAVSASAHIHYPLPSPPNLTPSFAIAAFWRLEAITRIALWAVFTKVSWSQGQQMMQPMKLYRPTLWRWRTARKLRLFLMHVITLFRGRLKWERFIYFSSILSFLLVLFAFNLK